jgi:ABC-2 type transport system ATP-binding protein
LSAPLVTVRGVSKRYGTVVAVDNVTVDVRPGEVYALVGLNGAGKTTLIRMLLGMVHATAGQIEVVGRPVTDRSVWSQVGYLVESPSAYPELTVRENLEVTRRLRKIPDRAPVEDAIDLFGLRPYADRRARTLSLGNAQRLGLAKALLHRPSLLVLDEPVNGLDPAGVVEIRTLLVDLARRHGTTVFLSSHLLAEVARTATRIGVLHHGRLVDEFDAEALAARVHPRLEIGARDSARAGAVLRQAGFDVHDAAGGLILDDDWAVNHPESVATALVRAGEPPTRLAVTEEDLENYFLRLVHATTTESQQVPGVR